MKVDRVSELALSLRRYLALKQILDIAEGSTTANSLPHIAKIAREALADHLAVRQLRAPQDGRE